MRGRKAKVPELGEAMFQWFIDVRESLKGRWKCFVVNACKFILDDLNNNLSSFLKKSN